jgi:hypothetical protein
VLNVSRLCSRLCKSKMTVQMGLFLAAQEHLRNIGKTKTVEICYGVVSTILGIKAIFNSQRGNGGKWFNGNSKSSAQFLTRLQCSVVASRVVTFSSRSDLKSLLLNEVALFKRTLSLLERSDFSLHCLSKSRRSSVHFPYWNEVTSVFTA